MHNLKILAVIPARSGSKSIPDKNIQSFLGKPLLVHSIDHALQSELINRVIVSTDSELYADIGKSAGAEIPFLRPASIAGDFSTDLEVFQHTLHFLEEKESYSPDIIVHLRPTTPIRQVKDIDQMIKKLINTPKADAIRAISKMNDTPFKMWFLGEDQFIVPVVSHEDIKEAYNMPRQTLPPAYIQTASIDVIRRETIMEKNSMTGNTILGHEVFAFHDIDHSQDLEVAIAAAYQPATGQRYCFDLDGVIAHLSPQNDYNLATPNKAVIKKVNALHETGNYIIIFTARGSATGIDWYDVTVQQLSSWGVRYDEFHTGKPYADFYIDDKNLLISQFLKS